MIEIDEDEKIEKVVRKHWFVLLGQIIILILLVALPIALVAWGLISGIPGFPAILVVFFLFFWLLIVWMMAWKIWTDFYLDVLIITDKRVFDIDQIGFFNRQSASFRLDRIQNVTITVDGIIQTFFNFGTIRIETAGEKEEFIAPYIADPYNVKKYINVRYDEEVSAPQAVHVTRTDPSKNDAGHSPSDV